MTAWPLLGWRAGIFIRILVLRVVGGDAADEREESSAAAFGVSRGGGIDREARPYSSTGTTRLSMM